MCEKLDCSTQMSRTTKTRNSVHSEMAQSPLRLKSFLVSKPLANADDVSSVSSLHCED